jgi:hypothetical protein
LATEVVKLLVKPLKKLYHTGPWLFGYWSCEAARETAHDAIPNGPHIEMDIRGLVVTPQDSGIWVQFPTNSRVFPAGSRATTARAQQTPAQ